MYSLIRFGLMPLPRLRATTDVGVGPSVATVRQLADGSQLRSHGSRRAPIKRTQIRRTATLIEPTPQVLAAAYDQICARSGTVDLLYRQSVNGDIHWMFAELTADVGQMTHASMFEFKGQWVQDVPLTFTLLGPVWNGNRHGPGQPYVGDQGVQSGITGTYDTDVHPLVSSTITLTNGGNVPVDHVVIKATAGNAPLTALTLTCGDAKWSWTGSVAATKALTIDTAMQRVLNDGVGAYSGFVRDNTLHRLDSWNWLKLAVGANSVTLAVTGGSNGNISFSFFDGWQ